MFYTISVLLHAGKLGLVQELYTGQNSGNIIDLVGKGMGISLLISPAVICESPKW